LTDTKGGVAFSDIALEFAATRQRAEAVIEGFDIEMVRSTVVRDYVFLTFVFVGLAMLVVRVRRSYPPGRWRDAGTTLMWASLGGGVLDAVEDTALLGFLGNWLNGADLWPAVAAVAATAKWLIVVVAVAYIVVGLVRWSLRSRSRPGVDPGRFEP
jgi:hypothetical protein